MGFPNGPRSLVNLPLTRRFYHELVVNTPRSSKSLRRNLTVTEAYKGPENMFLLAFLSCVIPWFINFVISVGCVEDTFPLRCRCLPF